MTVVTDAQTRELEREAIALWTSLSAANRRPSAVTIFKGAGRKSAVFRLHAAGPDGAAVVAKRAGRETALIERRVYEDVLPNLPVSQLRCHGFVDRPVDGAGWLFLEDAGDVEFSPRDATHRALAGTWLASVHTLTGALSPDLPTRDLDYYRALVQSVREMLTRTVTNPALEVGDRALVVSSAASCAAVDAQWAAVEGICRGVGQTLVLGGFGSKNVRIRRAAHDAALCPFDFESAGWGVPAIDLADVEIPAYTDAASRHWGWADRRAVERLSHVGKIFASVKGLAGEEATLTSSGARKVMGKIEFYCARIEESLHRLGLGHD
jgi:hypothetical protein